MHSHSPKHFPPESLRSQLLLSLVLGVVLILGIFWWLTQVSLHELSDRYVVTRLEHDTQSIEDHLVKKEGFWHLDHWSVGPIYLSKHSGHYYQVVTEKRTLSSPSLDGFDLAKSVGAQDAVVVYKTKGPVENVLLVRESVFMVEGEYIKVFVAENHDPIHEVLLEFDSLFAVLTLIALLSIYGFQRTILNNAFGRFKPLEKKLEAFQQGQDVTINPANYPQEIRSLVDTLNLTLSNSRQQFLRSRQLNSDLSHSLKTPLNLIFQLLESPELEQHPQLRLALRHEAQRIYEKIEHELKAERIASYQIIQLLQVEPLALELQKTFLRLYQDKSLNFDLQIAQRLEYRLEQEDAYELFGNLLDNASKWAKSRVRLIANEQGFSIEDDGIGVTAEALGKLQQRGYRADESQPGHGIGLSIVKRLVDAYGMKMTLTNSQLGGLKIDISW